MNDPEVFLWMIFDEGKSRVLLDPKISLVKLDDEESSLKRCEWLLGDSQENLSLVFKVGRGLEGRMIFEVRRWFLNLEEQ